MAAPACGGPDGRPLHPLPGSRRMSSMDLAAVDPAPTGCAVVAVGGEVDLETASQLGEHALDALREVSPHLALDLSAA